MEVLAILQMVVAFVMTHWDSVALVSVLGTGLFHALKQKAFKEAGYIALELVRQVAIKELAGVEKRKLVVEELYKRLPVWAKKFVDQAELEVIAEKAYQLLRGDIKALERGEIPVADFIKSVDPTVGIVSPDGLKITAPDNLKL